PFPTRRSSDLLHHHPGHVQRAGVIIYNPLLVKNAGNGSTYPQPILHPVVQCKADIAPLVIGIAHDAVLIRVTEGNAVYCFFRATLDVDMMVLAPSWPI